MVVHYQMDQPAPMLLSTVVLSTFLLLYIQVYHSVLNMKEPRYEYHFTQPYYRDWSSNYQPANGSIPFDHWLNMRRDPKEIQQEVVVKKLQKHHPFRSVRVAVFTKTVKIGY